MTQNTPKEMLEKVVEYYIHKDKHETHEIPETNFYLLKIENTRIQIKTSLDEKNMVGFLFASILLNKNDYTTFTKSCLLRLSYCPISKCFQDYPKVEQMMNGNIDSWIEYCETEGESYMDIHNMDLTQLTHLTQLTEQDMSLDYETTTTMNMIFDICI